MIPDITRPAHYLQQNLGNSILSAEIIEIAGY
jgi:hypothetical protein